VRPRGRAEALTPGRSLRAMESEHGIVVDREKVAKIAGATVERVRAHAEELGRHLLSHGEPVESSDPPT